MNQPLFSTNSLCRFYVRGPQTIRAVDEVDLEIERGAFVAIVGSSGSGKSTLLNLLSSLDTPTSGTINFDGTPFSTLSRREAAAYRGKKVGMVFQSFNLLHHRTALENVEFGLQFDDTPHSKRKAMASEMLERLGLQDRLGHRPSDLSGGEQQRVALARALVKQPTVLFADEPTGSLDEENSSQIIDLFSQLNRDGLTIIIVTHNLNLASHHAKSIIQMRYGRIVNQIEAGKEAE